MNHPNISERHTTAFQVAEEVRKLETLGDMVKHIRAWALEPGVTTALADIAAVPLLEKLVELGHMKRDKDGEISAHVEWECLEHDDLLAIFWFEGDPMNLTEPMHALNVHSDSKVQVFNAIS